MVAIEQIAVFGIGALLMVRGLGMVKLPIKKNVALLLGLAMIVGGAWYWNVGGVQQYLANVPSGQGAGATTGAAFTVEPSETDTNINMDYANHLFTVSYMENTDADAIYTNVSQAGHGENLISVTATLTVRDQTLGNVGENGDVVIPIRATVQTFQGEGENASTTYYPITKDTENGTGWWNITFTPSGETAHEEFNTLTVSRGGSKAVVINATLSQIGLRNLDNLEFKDVTITVGDASLGQSVYTQTLRFLKVGEVQ